MCVSSCSGSYPFTMGNFCVASCPLSATGTNGSTVIMYTYGNQCVESCPVNTYQQLYSCVSTCQTPFVPVDSYCILPNTSSPMSPSSCNASSPMFMAGNCVSACNSSFPYNSNNSCLTSCPFYKNSSNLTLSTYTCLSSCPAF
jgi:hypothetical protein